MKIAATIAKILAAVATIAGAVYLIATYGDNPEDMRKAGIDYAIRQILDLKANGVDGIHIYTMNKPKMAAEIVNNIR